jgi:hypothetical protein
VSTVCPSQAQTIHLHHASDALKALARHGYPPGRVWWGGHLLQSCLDTLLIELACARSAARHLSYAGSADKPSATSPSRCKSSTTMATATRSFLQAPGCIGLTWLRRRQGAADIQGAIGFLRHRESWLDDFDLMHRQAQRIRDKRS